MSWKTVLFFTCVPILALCMIGSLGLALALLFNQMWFGVLLFPVFGLLTAGALGFTEWCLN